jgi:hypothetical protein
MGRTFVCVLLVAAAASAQSRARYVTELGRRVLVLCDMVAVGEVNSVNPPFRGVSTARLRMSEHLSGLERRRDLTLMYIEDYLAPDAIRATFESETVTFQPRRSEKAKRILDNEEGAAGSRPEVGDREKERATNVPGASAAGSGVRLLKGEKGIFFLRRKGTAFALIGFIPERDPLFARKKKRLDDMLAIEAVGSADAKLRAAKSYFMKELRSKDLWKRGNAAREIEALSRRHADAFNESERRFLAESLYLEENANIASALERAVRGVAPDEALAYAFEAEQRERETFAKALEREQRVIAANKVPELRAADLVRLAGRYGRAATELLCGYLADPEPIVRESVAGVLARHGGPSCRDPLRESLAKEANPDAARAMIHTLGVKSDPLAVPIIVKQLDNRDNERTAVQALARIGTDEAWAALRAYRPKASGPARALIDTFLKDRAKAR